MNYQTQLLTLIKHKKVRSKIMRKQEVRFKSSDIELSATLALPDTPGPYIGVVLVAGSGPIDRDENHARIKLNVFRDISQFLASQGIATLRYDKRGVGESGGDYFSAGFNDNSADALAALETLRVQKDIDADRLFILGHSEGAHIATKLAGSGARACGAILLAGAAKTGEETLKWQALKVADGLKGLSGWIIRTFHIDVAKAQQKQIDRIKKSGKDWIRVQFVKLNAKWFREFMAYDPSADFPRITMPVLAITGSKDIQVDPTDLERMAGLVKAPFEGHLIDGMTHMLRVQEKEAVVANYREEVKRPVDPGMLGIIAGWIKKQAGV